MTTKIEHSATQLASAANVKNKWNGVMYNVLEEGLVGGGIVNDTAALQALVNKAVAAGRKNILFPHNTYYVTDLTDADQVNFMGDNSSFVGGYMGTISDIGGIAALDNNDIYFYNNLKNFSRKINSGENVLIHCVGDSVTLGVQTATVDETFVAVVADLLATKYPLSTVIRYDGTYAANTNTINTWTEHVIQEGTNDQTIIITRNGIGGNTLMKLFNRPQDYTGYFSEWDNDLYPDLIMPMIGLNDSLTSFTTRYVPAADFKQGLISFVKLIRNTHPSCDIAFITPTWYGDGTTAVTSLDDYANAMKEVSYIEGTGLVDIHKQWIDHLVIGTENYGQGDWLIDGDAYHPTVAGHAAIGNMIFSMVFDRATRTEQRDSGISKRTYLIPYNSADAVRSGTWTLLTTDLGTTEFNEYISNSGSATVTIRFKGNKISLLARKTSSLGTFTAAIDGGVAVEFSQYRAYPTSKVDYTDPNQAIYPHEKILLADDLTDGIHTCVIDVGTGYVSFAGAEIECNVDNSKVPTTFKQNQIINSGKVTALTVTGTSKVINVTFDEEHVAIPVVVATGSTVGHIVIVDHGNLTKTGARFYVSRADGSDFGGANLIITYMSIG